MTVSTAVPTQATSGAVLDTTEDSAQGLMVQGAPIADPGEALRNPHAAEVNKLNTFLMQAFPGAMGRTNRQTPESPVDVAIRLLQGLGATGVHPHCTSEYCNLPRGHQGEHGIVNYTPR